MEHTSISLFPEEEKRNLFKKFSQEIIPVKERDFFISNLLIAGENSEQTEKDFQCLLCLGFVNEPLVCCKSCVVCKKCLDLHLL